MERYKADPVFRLTMNLRNRLRKVLRQPKNRTTKKLNRIGCSRSELRDYLESKFYDGMTWENYGKHWVVDHIKPISSFDLTNEAERNLACNYLNLQPLLKRHNEDKGDRLDWVHPSPLR